MQALPAHWLAVLQEQPEVHLQPGFPGLLELPLPPHLAGAPSAYLLAQYPSLGPQGAVTDEGQGQKSHQGVLADCSKQEPKGIGDVVSLMLNWDYV